MSLLQKRVLRLRLRSWGLVMLTMPLVAWGCLNLLFSTSLGTVILCDKIEEKIGLPCRLKSVTWSPWSGVTASEFRVFAPDQLEKEEAILAVGETRIDMSWSSLLKGKKCWERLEVDQLELDVSLEVLSGILGRSMATPSRQEPAARPIDEDYLSAPGPSEKSEDQSVNVPPLAREDVPVGVDHENPSSTAAEDFEGVVILSNARVKIYSERAPALFLTLEKIEGEIPLWGGSREGELSCEKIEISEVVSEVGFSIPLLWRNDAVSVVEQSLKVFGLDLQLSAAVKVTAGFPAGFQIKLPEQQIDLSSVFRERKSPLSVGSLTSRSRLQGFLSFPASFKGSSVTRFEDLVIEDPRDEGDMRFDRGVAIFVVSAAGIVARDIRAVGEQDAVLANGFASAKGEAAATVRIVSSPDRAESHAKRVRMAHGNLLMEFQPLITPDREFRDIRIEARDGTLMMDLGEDRSWVSFFAAAKAILGQQNTDLTNLP